MRERILTGFRELDLCPTDELRRAVVGRVLERLRGQGWGLIIAETSLAGAGLYCLVLAVLGATLGLRAATLPVLLLLTVLIGVPTIAVRAWLRRCFAHKLLREELLKAGVRFCLSCGYGLLGATGNRCPECGCVQSQ